LAFAPSLARWLSSSALPCAGGIGTQLCG
jgi:hypothetical protein